jgi:hypothetical protein
MKKLIFYLLLIVFLANVTLQNVLQKTSTCLLKIIFFVDSVETKNIDLQKYILQKPNNKLLGVPLSLYLHNLGNANKPKTPSEWGKKHLKTYNFIKTLFSEKQSIAYANTFIKLNNRFLSYQAPVIVNKTKVSKTSKIIYWLIIKQKGFFEAKVSSKIDRDSLNKKSNSNL